MSQRLLLTLKCSKDLMKVYLSFCFQKYLSILHRAWDSFSVRGRVVVGARVVKETREHSLQNH